MYEYQALITIFAALYRIAGRPSVQMRRTTCTAASPVLHLPVRSLLQIALLNFLALLFASLGQISGLLQLLSSSATSNTVFQLRERQFLYSSAHPQLLTMEKRNCKREGKLLQTLKGKGVMRSGTVNGPSAHPSLAQRKAEDYNQKTDKDLLHLLKQV